MPIPPVPNRCIWFALLAILLTGAFACQKSESAGDATQPVNQVASEEPPEPVDPSIVERIKREKWTGDLSGMAERRYVRALVSYNRTYYFYDGAEAKGISYEGLREFEKFLNRKLNTGKHPIGIIFVPVQRGELIQGLIDGRGDIAASNIAIDPEAQAVVDYSDPVRENAPSVVVTGPTAPAVATLDDLSGKEVYVRKLSRYWRPLEQLNDEFKKAGKAPIDLKASDEDLEDEDILEMVNAGVVGMTVVDSTVADLWSKVFPSVVVHTDVTVGPNMSIGWAFRKNSPELAAAVNEFVRDHRTGTSFGNTLIRRYFQNTKFIVNANDEEERKKFRATVETFKKYAGEYGFDWLMVAAQAYQESRLDQNAHSPAGAVGVMQIKPSTAAGPPINIDNVNEIEANVHAGVKYMRYMMDEHFKESSMDKVNKGLFAFASYNAGPARVAKLRKIAREEGLDPDRWFNNVELIAGREIGPETVTYVSNIYKYYVAFKQVEETEKKRSKKKG
jgi:membrane-bound lytic murein transglycosylase MltF